MNQTTQNKLYSTQAFCLKTWDYGESDKILHLFSAEYGKISAIAKGVKKQKSKLAGACEILHLSEIQLSKGKNLDVLSQYETVESFPHLRQDIMKLACAMLFAELVHGLVNDHEPDTQGIFGLLQEHLSLLDHCPNELTLPVAVQFQVQLLEAAGFHPSLTQCVITDEPIDTNQSFYPFSAELGGITTSLEARNQYAHLSWVNVSTSTLVALSDALSSKPLTAWPAEVQALKVQKFLKFYFTQKLEHPIKAYDFLLSLIT